MTFYVAALAVIALLAGIAFVILPAFGYQTAATIAFAVFIVVGIFLSRYVYRMNTPADEIREPETFPEPAHNPINETEAAQTAEHSEGDTTMKIWLSVISILAGLSSYVTGIAIFVVYVLTYTAFTIPGTTYSFSLVKYGLIGLGAYAFLNLIDAFTPQSSPRLNNFGRNAARFALVVISISGIITIMQFGFDLDRIKTVFREDYSIAVLFLTAAYAWFDATLLQLIKNWSLRRNTTTASPTVDEADDAIVTDSRRAEEILRSFGINMHNCNVAVVDARGKDLVIRVDDHVNVRTVSPADLATAVTGDAHAA